MIETFNCMGEMMSLCVFQLGGVMMILRSKLKHFTTNLKGHKCVWFLLRMKMSNAGTSSDLASQNESIIPAGILILRTWPLKYDVTNNKHTWPRQVRICAPHILHASSLVHNSSF